MKPAGTSVNPVKPIPVESDLVIDLVDLATDAINVLILGIDFVAHSPRKPVEPTRRTVQCRYVAVDFLFHGLICEFELAELLRHEKQ
jgi:hypothetical protein